MARRLSAPLTLYRIADTRYPLYSGRAAGQVGFRWNPRGMEVVYASTTYAGAMLEKLVHTGTGRLPVYQFLITISLPAGLRIEEVDRVGSLNTQPRWRRYAGSQRIGKQWFERGRTAVLLVPSVVYEGMNAIIDPVHADAARLTVSRPRQIRWDQRLFSENE